MEKPKYRALVFQGSNKAVKELIERAWTDADEPKPFLNEDKHINAGSFLRQVAELVGVKKHQVHVVATAKWADALVAAAAGDDVTVKSNHPVEGARFDFDFEVFGRSKEAKEILAAMRDRPDGVALRGYTMPEEPPEAEGVELDERKLKLVESGTGTAFGPLDDVMEFHDSLREFPVIVSRPIHLILED